MTIELKPEQQRMIDSAIRSGAYRNYEVCEEKTINKTIDKNKEQATCNRCAMTISPAARACPYWRADFSTFNNAFDCVMTVIGILAAFAVLGILFGWNK